ncbi:MAG: ribulose-phosphate 3-epimerase [Spirochaetaceae bacterium]|jgi:D-allulose-6-phosphate 3-epimerase|nr:ribulose-phosphate 3-epimerase [Spirochaetaceae bacterium]
MKPEFSISLMCIDYLNIKEQVQILNTKADYYHIDIMDGHFCKNITLSPDFMRSVKKIARLPFDVHLMVEYPNDFIDLVRDAGADIISPHAETINTDAFRVINKIKSLGAKAGVVLNPATPLEYIKHYAGRLDLITIMTVDVGYAGQKFIPEMLDKIRQCKEWKAKYGWNYKISIDGSCNASTFKMLQDAGAEIYILGTSGLFALDSNLNTAWDKMKQNFDGLHIC